MWLCRRCGESCDEEFNACWNCQTTRSGEPLTNEVNTEARLAIDDPDEGRDDVDEDAADEGFVADDGEPEMALVTVLSTEDEGLILAARAALLAEDIPFIEQDKNRSLRNAFGVQRGIDHQPFEFQVRTVDEARARAVVDGLTSESRRAGV